MRVVPGEGGGVYLGRVRPERVEIQVVGGASTSVSPHSNFQYDDDNEDIWCSLFHLPVPHGGTSTARSRRSLAELCRMLAAPSTACCDPTDLVRRSNACLQSCRRQAARRAM